MRSATFYAARMEFVFHAIAACRDGLTSAAALSFGVPAALFLAGLGGSVIHCAGMCGPFVLAQVMSDAEAMPVGRYGEWRRLRGAALMPYQLGRFTTYTLLGALAGGMTSLFVATQPFEWLATGLLLIAAVLLLTQALGLAFGPAAPFAAGLTWLAAPLSRSRTPAARYALGVVLGFLPCGLLYGAIAAAAGTASAVTGTIGMAAFATGTMPALILVGWGGAFARRRLNEVSRWLAAPLLLANAALMTALAVQRL